MVIASTDQAAPPVSVSKRWGDAAAAADGLVGARYLRVRLLDDIGQISLWSVLVA